MSERPGVSVIVPHYRDLARLDVCLASLQRQTYPAQDFEVIVADNASPEGEAAIAKAIAGRARLTIATESGAGPARNAGVAVSRGRLLAFIDCDCIAEPEWLAEGIRALDDYDFVGGRVKVLVEDEAKMTGAEAFERVFAFDLKTYITRKGFTATANLFCSRAVFDTVGDFRTGVSEDVEWSHRARSKGMRLGYAPLAVVGHPARRDWSELIRKWRRLNVETYGLFKARKGGRLIWLVRSLLLPASALAHSPRVLTSPQLTSLGQRLAALGILYRLRLWRLGDALRLLIQPGRA